MVNRGDWKIPCTKVMFFSLIIVVLTGCGSSTIQKTSGTKQAIQLTKSADDNNQQNSTSLNISSNSNRGSNLGIEKGAVIKTQKKEDLFGNRQIETIALVNLPLVKGQDYSGYLGIWDAQGKLLQKFTLHGYNIMFPIKIYTNDLNNDGKLDIILETDEHANGGNGIHDIYVFIQKDKIFSEKPLPQTPVASFVATYQLKNKSFLIQSQKNKSRTWSTKLSPDIMKNLNNNLLKGKHDVNIDPISEINVNDGYITTKRLLWFGKLQLNSLGFLVTQYKYENGKWIVTQYNIQSNGTSNVTEK